MCTQKTRVSILVILSIATLCSQASAQGSISDADKAAIKKVTEHATALANAPTKDWAAYVKAYYAPDATVLPPNAAAVKGQEALTSFFASFPPILNLGFERLELDGAGGLAYVWGTYSLDMLPPGAESPINDLGKYIEIWRKQEDGSWRVTLDIFNSDLPLPEAETKRAEK